MSGDVLLLWLIKLKIFCCTLRVLPSLFIEGLNGGGKEANYENSICTINIYRVAYREHLR